MLIFYYYYFFHFISFIILPLYYVMFSYLIYTDYTPLLFFVKTYFDQQKKQQLAVLSYIHSVKLQVVSVTSRDVLDIELT